MTVDLTIDPDLALENPILSDVLTLWRSQAGTTEIPPWTAFDPTQMPPRLLPHLYLIDGLSQDTPRPRWRLLGTHTTETLGRDNTGRYFDEVYSPEDAEAMSMPVLWVLRERRPLRIYGASLFANKEWLYYECIYLPYSTQNAKVGVILGAIVFG